MNDNRWEIGHVQKWLDSERAYAEGKWPLSTVDELSPLEYHDWVTQYLHQALVLGVTNNPRGRQRLAKALRTLLAFVESNVRQYGPLPTPGQSSTEDIKEWDAA